MKLRPRSRSIFNRVMELNEEAKNAVRELGEAINAAVEKSSRVAEAIETLREIGYEPNLMLKLEIGLQHIGGCSEAMPAVNGENLGDIELDLTEDDLRTLRRMKISIE